eukprot:GILK01004160.1.p1 GENE.GILK01004160.1~~GILK01004160.1.p1  ORF type:complete len:1291 (+),score=310.51 GILK01004160.1:81-3875(+)
MPPKAAPAKEAKASKDAVLQNARQPIAVPEEPEPVITLTADETPIALAPEFSLESLDLEPWKLDGDQLFEDVDAFFPSDVLQHAAQWVRCKTYVETLKEREASILRQKAFEEEQARLQAELEASVPVSTDELQLPGGSQARSTMRMTPDIGTDASPNNFSPSEANLGPQPAMLVVDVPNAWLKMEDNKPEPPPTKSAKAKGAQVKKEEVKQEKRYPWPSALSSVMMDSSLPLSASAIAAQLSLISQHTSYFAGDMGGFMLDNIYPKNEAGCPAINPSGRYVVKLFHIGRWRRVVVDDRIPLDENGNVLLPRTNNSSEIWTFLVAKAIYKLYNYVNAQPITEEQIVHALTGWVVHNLNLPAEKQDAWSTLSNLDGNTNGRYIIRTRFNAGSPASRPSAIVQLLEREGQRYVRLLPSCDGENVAENSWEHRVKVPEEVVIPPPEVDPEAEEAARREEEVRQEQQRLAEEQMKLQQQQQQQAANKKDNKVKKKEDEKKDDPKANSSVTPGLVAVSLPAVTRQPIKPAGGFWVSFEELFQELSAIVLYCNPFTYSNQQTVFDLAVGANAELLPQQPPRLLYVTVPEDKEIELLVAFTPLPLFTASTAVPVPSTSLVQADTSTDSGEERAPTPAPVVDSQVESPMIYSLTLEQFQWKSDEPQFGLRVNTTGSPVSHLLALSQGTHVFRLLNTAPLGYVLHLAADTGMEIGDYGSILGTRLGLNLRELEEEHQPQKEQVPYVWLHALFTVSTTSRIILQLQVEDRRALPFVRLHTIDLDRMQRSTHPLLITAPVSFAPNKKGYAVVAECCAPAPLRRGKHKLRVLSSEPLATFEPVPFKETQTYMDIYKPNKYAILAQEVLQVSQDTMANLHLQVVVPPEVSSSVFLTVSLKNNGVEVASASGEDKVSLPYVTLSSPQNVEADRPANRYVLTATLNKYRWPEIVEATDYPVQWRLKISSNIRVACFRDTQKEDKEASIRQSWEEGQPGRAARALLSRQRFLRGEVVERSMTPAVAVEEAPSPAPGKKTAAVKGKTAHDKEKEREQHLKEQQNQQAQILSAPPPNPQDHINNEIKSFLTHALAPRKRELQGQHPPILRDDEYTQRTLGTVQEAVELDTQQRKELTEQRRQEQEGRLKIPEQVQLELSTWRQSQRTPQLTVLQSREAYRLKMEKKRQKTEALRVAMASGKVETMEPAIRDAKESFVETSLIEQAELICKQVIRSQAEEKLRKATDGNNYDNLSTAIQRAIETGVPAALIEAAQAKLDTLKKK